MTAENAPEQRLAWEYLAHSEVGLVRKDNQDSGLVSGDLLMVADGMGGAAAGDLASAVAVDTLAKTDLTQTSDRESPEPVEGPPADEGTGRSTRSGRLARLARAISAANTRIADLVTTDYTLEGMGTTVTAAVLDGAGIGLAHIGDSRGYLFRDGRLEQLTHDHSWVQSLIDEGKISPEEAAAHPHRSLLLKVLNGQPSNEPDLSRVPLYPGDRLLLCSDGLCGFVEHEDIAEALTGTNRREAMDQLVEAAHAAGGLDNITIIIADLMDAAANDLEAAATRASIPTQPGSGRSREPRSGTGSAQEVDGPNDTPQLLGAAADSDIAGEEEQIHRRVAQRAADLNDDGDFVDADYEDAGDLEDEDRYAPQAPRKLRWRRPLILTLVVVLLVAVASAAGFSWTRTQYYVGADDQRVAIYQGLNEAVPGLPLSRVYEVQQLNLDDLPLYYQGLVREGIEAGTLDSARATVEQLKVTAQRCASSPPPPPAGSPSPTPTGTANASPTTKPTSHRTTGKPHPKTTAKASPKTSPKTSPKRSPKPTAKTSPKPTANTSVQPSPQSTTSPTSPGQLPGDGKC